MTSWGLKTSYDCNQGCILPPCPLGHGQGGFFVQKKIDDRFQSNATFLFSEIKQKTWETNNLISEAAKLLRKNDDVFERDFISKLSQIGKHINELRNARGDLSHGKYIPKELLNDQDLSRLLREITESLSRYLISSFFSFALEKKSKEDFEIKESRIRYEENPEFNDLLDEEYPLDGKLLYSQALYTLYYEDYEIRLQTFLDEQAMLNEE